MTTRCWARAVGVLLVAGIPLSAPAQTVDLATALEDVLADHPRLAAAEQRVAAAEAGQAERAADGGPDLDVSASVGPEYTDVRDDTRTTLTRREMSVAVVQPLFDSGETQARRRAADAQRDVAAAERAATRADLLRDGAQAYLDVREAHALVTERQAAEDRLAGLLDDARERSAGGTGTELSVARAEAQMALATQARIAAESRRGEALARYREIFDTRPDPAALAPVSLPDERLPGSRDAAIERALAAAPALARTRAQTARLEAQRDRAAAAAGPQVNLLGELSYQEDVNGSQERRNTAALLLRGSWRVNLSGAVRHRTTRADRRAQAASQDAAATRLQVRRQAESAWARYTDALERVSATAGARASAREAAAATERLVGAGRAEPAQLLAAEQQRSEAAIQHTQARFALKRAKLALLRATARLTPAALGVTAP